MEWIFYISFQRRNFNTCAKIILKLMEIEYTNISIEDFIKLSEEESKKPYCIEYSNGDKSWIIKGKLHREDEPAILCIDGRKYWYLNDFKYSFEEWCKKLNKSDEEIIFLRLKYS